MDVHAQQVYVHQTNFVKVQVDSELFDPNMNQCDNYYLPQVVSENPENI